MVLSPVSYRFARQLLNGWPACSATRLAIAAIRRRHGRRVVVLAGVVVRQAETGRQTPGEAAAGERDQELPPTPSTASTVNASRPSTTATTPTSAAEPRRKPPIATSTTPPHLRVAGPTTKAPGRSSGRETAEPMSVRVATGSHGGAIWSTRSDRGRSGYGAQALQAFGLGNYPELRDAATGQHGRHDDRESSIRRHGEANRTVYKGRTGRFGATVTPGSAGVTVPGPRAARALPGRSGGQPPPGRFCGPVFRLAGRRGGRCVVAYSDPEIQDHAACRPVAGAISGRAPTRGIGPRRSAE